MTDKDKCKHPPEALEFLFHHLTPNVEDTILLSVAICMFHCKECGSLIQKHAIVSRGYSDSGAIPEEFQVGLDELKQKKETEKAVDQRVQAELQKIMSKRGQAHG